MVKKSSLIILSVGACYDYMYEVFINDIFLYRVQRALTITPVRCTGHCILIHCLCELPVMLCVTKLRLFGKIHLD